MSDAAAPLAGLRVLDLSTEIAGPYATKLLADAGAEVVKLEPPAGDPLRRWTASGTPLPAGEDGALFRFLNAGKQSAVAALDTPAGRARLAELAAGADLVFESGGPLGPIAREGGRAALARENPALVLVSLSPFGWSGPWAERPATEWTLQAASGATAYRGLPERGPVGAGGRLGEWCAGPYAALGGLAAWLAARAGGAGQHVDVSLFEAVVSAMTIYHDLQGQFYPGPLPQSIDTPSIEPAKDGWVGFATYTGQQWKDFCAMIGRPEMAQDERLYDGRARMAHLATVQQAMHAWTREHAVDEIVELATLLRIPVAPIGDGRRVLEFDQLRERGVFQRSAHGFQQPRVPYQLEHFTAPAFAPAPRLGEHAQAQLPARPRAAAAPAAPELPLRGLRVVDLTAFWAGPVATSLLADLGADVIKIESTRRPDGFRFVTAVRNDQLWEWAPLFHGANPGKRDLTLDLDSERGRELLLALIARADVVAENFSVRVMEHFGLDWPTLRARNPRLIFLRMPAWGLDGPWRDRVGFAPNVEQVSGLAWMTGYPDMPLVPRGVCDPIGGMHACFALLLALEQRRRTGEGQRVEAPLVEPALNFAAEGVIEWSAYGQLLARSGNRGPYAAPQGAYRCRPPAGERDCEWLAVAVADDAQWLGLRRALGDPAALRAPELSSSAGRRAAHDAIDAVLSAWCAERSCAVAEAALLAEGVPASQLVNAHFLMPNPQLEARGFFQALAHPLVGTRRYPGLPMRFSAWGSALHRAASPTLGQHNDEILRELGLSADEIQALRDAKLVGERPAFA